MNGLMWDGTVEPNLQDQTLRRDLTTRRVCNDTRLIPNLLKVMTIHTLQTMKRRIHSRCAPISYQMRGYQCTNRIQHPNTACILNPGRLQHQYLVLYVMETTNTYPTTRTTLFHRLTQPSACLTHPYGCIMIKLCWTYKRGNSLREGLIYLDFYIRFHEIFVCVGDLSDHPNFNYITGNRGNRTYVRYKQTPCIHLHLVK